MSLRLALAKTNIPAVRRLAGALLAAGLACAVISGTAAGAPRLAKPEENKAPDDKAAVRNNAASLLADLLGQEKNVSKILIIKHNSAALGELIKAISKTADEGAKQLDALAKSDPSLNLKAMDLPPGERESRAATGKAKEHELLSSSGAAFQFNLLMTQAQATDYGSRLAKVAADNATSPEEAKEFNALNASLSHLNGRVTAMMRGAASAPAKKD